MCDWNQYRTLTSHPRSATCRASSSFAASLNKSLSVICPSAKKASGQALPSGRSDVPEQTGWRRIRCWALSCRFSKNATQALGNSAFRHVRINAAGCAYCIHASDEALPSNSTQREATPQASGAKFPTCRDVSRGVERRSTMLADVPLPFPTPGSRRRAI